MFLYATIAQFLAFDKLSCDTAGLLQSRLTEWQMLAAGP
jgi:hypothetical protein